MKELLITSGFPRSGSTYLNQALNLLYYPDQEVNWNRHTVVAIKQADNIMVTFRNPVDSIASWHKYPSNGQLEEDIKYYLRFYKAVIENLNKVSLMDFDYFTKDIEYIKDKVLKKFGISTDNVTTDSQVKEAMLANNKELNLPRNNKEELEVIKAELQQMPEFTECLKVYATLKKL